MGTPWLASLFPACRLDDAGDRGAKNRDKHAHLSLAGDERSSEERAKAPDMTMVLAGVFHLPQYLDAGVTTVHDNGMRQSCPLNF